MFYHNQLLFLQYENISPDLSGLLRLIWCKALQDNAVVDACKLEKKLFPGNKNLCVYHVLGSRTASNARPWKSEPRSLDWISCFSPRPWRSLPCRTDRSVVHRAAVTKGNWRSVHYIGSPSRRHAFNEICVRSRSPASTLSGKVYRALRSPLLRARPG